MSTRCVFVSSSNSQLNGCNYPVCVICLKTGGERGERFFVPGEPPVMWLSCRECHILVPGAPWYISELGIYQRSSGETKERTLGIDEWFFVSPLHSMPTIPCAMPAFFHNLLHVSLHLLKFFLLSLLQAESSSHKVPFLQRASIGFPQKSIGNHHLKQWPQRKSR